MGNVVRLQHRHGEGHARAVVRSQGGSVRVDAVAVPQNRDGILGKIMIRSGIFLAHHIQVGLENDRGGTFIARGGILFNDQVVRLVLPDLQPPVLAEQADVIADRLLVFGAVWNPTQLPEQLEHPGWLQPF